MTCPTYLSSFRVSLSVVHPSRAKQRPFHQSCEPYPEGDYHADQTAWLNWKAAHASPNLDSQHRPPPLAHLGPLRLRDISGRHSIRNLLSVPPTFAHPSLSARRPYTTFSHTPLNLHIFDPPPSKIHQISTTWLLLTLSSRVAFRRLLTP